MEVERSPKIHKEREVPLTRALRPYAKDADHGKRPDDLLFARPDGGQLTNHNLRRAVNWDKLRVAIGQPDLRIHDLRHTFATILLDAGASAPDVQATPGIQALQVTERYSRAREGVAQRAGSVLDTAFGDAKKPGRARINGTKMAQLSRSEQGNAARARKTSDPPRL